MTMLDRNDQHYSLDDPRIREDLRDQEIEEKATRLEAEAADEDYLDCLIDAIELKCSPCNLDFRPTGDAFWDEQRKIKRLRHLKNLRTLRNAIDCHRYEEVGRWLTQAVREKFVAKAGELAA